MIITIFPKRTVFYSDFKLIRIILGLIIRRKYFKKCKKLIFKIKGSITEVTNTITNINFIFTLC